jgi:hypothetical protein
VFLFRLIQRFAFASSGARNDKSKFARPFTLFASFADGRANCNRQEMSKMIFLKLDRWRKPGNRWGLCRNEAIGGINVRLIHRFALAISCERETMVHQQMIISFPAVAP